MHYYGKKQIYCTASVLLACVCTNALSYSDLM